MELRMQGDLNRRELLRAGLIAGAGLVLAGCKAGAKRQSWKPLSDDELNGPPKRPIARGGRIRQLPAQPAAPGGIIARREWTSAGVIMSLANPMNGVNRITIHHSGMDSAHLRTKQESARMLEAIRAAHVRGDWADIGYHYIIDPSGRIWEGRPVQFQGAHVKLNNEHNLGIMVMGNFDDERPTPAALTALDGFVADRMRALRVPIGQVYTHQELNPTACPGRNLQGYMVATRSGNGRMARA
jgi:hypothetical protein